MIDFRVALRLNLNRLECGCVAVQDSTQQSILFERVLNCEQLKFIFHSLIIIILIVRCDNVISGLAFMSFWFLRSYKAGYYRGSNDIKALLY